ncbi:hypothetical protein FA95DRAFT_226668 [Auriscalpium vulgare]|uniref:Uncharacterized protein n=1 Tax=Auriscalpium vulgare TaxID=40419 RepID=A0ACB8RLY4_9AGAM|nr:hypothetical protein FA95DRAFT_226668 [Auriscalpium vulgare]
MQSDSSSNTVEDIITDARLQSVTSGEWEFLVKNRVTTQWVQASHLTSAQPAGLVSGFCAHARARLAALSPWPTTSAPTVPALYSRYAVRAWCPPASASESYYCGLPFLPLALGDRHDIIHDTDGTAAYPALLAWARIGYSSRGTRPARLGGCARNASCAQTRMGTRARAYAAWMGKARSRSAFRCRARGTMYRRFPRAARPLWGQHAAHAGRTRMATNPRTALRRRRSGCTSSSRRGGGQRAHVPNHG